MDYLACVSYLE